MIEKKCQRERLLEIDNLHSTECGPPPSLDAKDKYVGYFENSFGEQWVFIGDHKAGKAVVCGGDANWAKHEVSRENPFPAGLILNEPEKQWIVACFMAMPNVS